MILESMKNTLQLVCQFLEQPISVLKIQKSQKFIVDVVINKFIHRWHLDCEKLVHCRLHMKSPKKVRKCPLMHKIIDMLSALQLQYD